MGLAHAVSVDRAVADEPAVDSPTPALDRRRHKRVSLTLLGRFMRANKQEFPCKLVDISVGGDALRTPVVVEAG